VVGFSELFGVQHADVVFFVESYGQLLRHWCYIIFEFWKWVQHLPYRPIKKVVKFDNFVRWV
jgi:hypothetical protein